MLKQSGTASFYALLLYIGEFLFEGDDIVGSFEPACGLALAVLLVRGKRYAWGMFLGAFLVHAFTDNSLWESFVIASSDMLQALCGVWLLTREKKFDSRLSSLHDYFRLILLGGCVSVGIGALFVNLMLLVSGSLVPANYFIGLLRWWMSDTLGVALVAPLMLVWRRTNFNLRNVRSTVEAILLLGVTFLVGQIVFADWVRDIVGDAPKDYWMFLLITWVAMLLGTRGTTVALIMVACQALFGAMQGVGFFAGDVAISHLMNFWFYILTLSMVGMSLATYFTELKEAKYAIATRDVLIREIHHRIKNNLQGITGLLRQSADGHPEIAESINHAIGQVQSIAVIHGLQESVPAGSLHLRELAEAVAAGAGSLWQKTVGIEVAPDWTPCTIDESEAVPMALVLNELLSNAIKHGGRQGQVWIALGNGQRSKTVQLTIHNTGQLPSDYDSGHNTGIGLQLVKSLMPRVGARLSWDCRDNTVTALLELEPPVINLEPQR